MIIDDKKTKTKQNSFLDSTDAGTGQFGDLLATVPARASGSRNVNTDPRKSQLGKDKEMDLSTLRRAWRERSRLLHPDVREQRSAEELEGIPSVYELNAAFEAVKKLL